MATRKMSDARVKTDMRLPRLLVKHVDSIVNQVGIPKNALFTIAASMTVVQLMSLLTPGKKRLRIFYELEELVQKTFEEAKKAL